MNKFSVALLSVLVLVAGPASASVIYLENFEDGVFNGAVDGSTLAGGLPGIGLFHVTRNYPATGNNALGFVRDETPGNTPNGTFASSPIANTIYSPSITLPGTGAISLNFDAANFGRGDNFYDRFDIGIFVDGTHFLKASSYLGYSVLGALTYPQDNGYNSLTAIISDFAGQSVRVYIHYNLVDGADDNFAGGRLDNLSVTDDNPVPEPGMVGLLGAGLIGLAFARRRTR